MPECQTCGGFVTENYARVFGDNDDNVSECRNCPTIRAGAEADSGGDRKVLLRDVRGEDASDRTDRSRDTADTPSESSGDEGSRPVVADDGATESSGDGGVRSGFSAVISALRS